jgi:hypothetical protein
VCMCVRACVYVCVSVYCCSALVLSLHARTDIYIGEMQCVWGRPVALRGPPVHHSHLRGASTHLVLLPGTTTVPSASSKAAPRTSSRKRTGEDLMLVVVVMMMMLVIMVPATFTNENLCAPDDDDNAVRVPRSKIYPLPPSGYLRSNGTRTVT